MDDVRELIWQQAKEKLFVSRDEYMAALDEWEIEPYVEDGKVWLVVLRKGPELHYMSVGAGKPLTGKTFRKMMEPQLEQYGYVTTRTPHTLERQHRINRWLGFVVASEDEFAVNYRLDRSAPCQS